MFNNKETLVLVDGSSYLYRAFHAIRELHNRKGEPTNALYGVLNMLKKLEESKPVHQGAFILDSKGKNFRHQICASYKATRKPMPDALRPQVTWVVELVALLGWKVLMVDAVEADDVIATLSQLGKKHHMHVLISSGDKDLTQLVDSNTTVINTMKDEILDPEGVEKKFGIKPEQMRDYLTLVGDTSDNIRGVDQCGPKTAVKWLKKYGSLSGIFEHLHEIKGKIGEKLQEATAWLPTSQKLLTLKEDVPLQKYLPNGLQDLKKGSPKWAELLPAFERFEFKKWFQEAQTHVGKGVFLEGSKNYPHRYEAITHDQAFADLLKRLNTASEVGIDTESTSLDEMKARLVGISFSFQEGEGFYLPLQYHLSEPDISLDGEKALLKLKPYLEKSSLKKIGQNLKYDQHVFANHNIELKGIYGDSMLASYLVESQHGHGLDELAERHLGIKTLTYEELCGKGSKAIGFADVPLKEATEYAAQDADLSLRLEKKLVALMDEQQQQLYRQLELPLLDILFAMERAGVLLDKKELQQQSRELSQRILMIEEQVYKKVGHSFNLSSPKQLQEVLFDELAIPTTGLKKTPTGGISTNEAVLAELALRYEVPALILGYRSLAKLKDTYTDKLPMLTDEEGRVHTTYAQAITKTGRLSSTQPNLQNIPIRTPEGRRIRKAFIAPADHLLLSADYSQIELRIVAHLSADKNLIAAFKEGEDVHRATAAQVFHTTADKVTSEERRYAKTINFGLIYGKSAYGLSKDLGISQEKARQFIGRYFEKYPGVARYMEETKKRAHEKGYVETLFGRRIYLPEIYADNATIRKGAERTAINAPVQGTAADLVKEAMIAVQNFLQQENLKSRMLMQVHDELILEVPEQEQTIVKNKIKDLMEQVADWAVPLVVDLGLGPDWQNAHS